MRVVGLLAVLGCSGGGQNLRLAVPDTTPAQRYTCRSGAECQPASEDVPENPAGTLFFVLPRECQGRVNQIFVRDAGSSHAELTVTCAPAEAPLGEMK
jgi:hypothetical protein